MHKGEVYLIDYNSSLKALYNWIKINGYYSWDPYDGLNSDKVYRLLKNSKFLQSLMIQINLYSPINMRKILHINKTIDLKAISILNQAYCNIHNKNINLTEEIKFCNLYIKEKSLKHIYNFDCWAVHSFKYVSFNQSELFPNEPDIIGISETIISLIQSHIIFNDEESKLMILSASEFLIKEFFKNNEKQSYFKYNFNDNNKIVLNASAKAIEALSNFLRIKKDKTIIDICNRTVNYLISMQNKDGSWEYSIYDTKKYSQYDFHQGYIIDGLISFLPYYEDEELLLEVIKKAALFYKKKLFNEKGESFYRYPIKYPIDIHNQAQGIITFNNLKKINFNFNSFEYKIADWTIKNMQDKSGYFYHQKWPLLTDKIAYLRWSQAWMLKALSVLNQY